MKTNIEKELIKAQKNIGSIFADLIKSWKLHLEYMQGKKINAKDIKNNIKHANKLNISIENTTYKILFFYAPTSINLMQTVIYIKATINLREIIRKSQDVFKSINDEGINSDSNKKIIAIEQEAIKVLEKTSFIVTNISNKEKISKYCKDIKKDIQDNCKAYKKKQTSILKATKKNIAIASDLDKLYHLQFLLDIENQCLCIAHNININSSRL